MQETKCSSKLLDLLRAFCRKRDLVRGMQVYAVMAHDSLESIALLADYFIRLLARCGYMEDADKAFSYVLKPSVYTWTALISGHADLGHALTAITLHFKMQHLGTEPDIVIFLCVIRACSSAGALAYGRLIHHHVLDSTLMLDNVAIENTLADMYAKCGSLDEARSLFDRFSNRIFVSWSVMIAGYAQHGYGDLAYEFFISMQDEELKPDKSMFLCILKVCSCMGNAEKSVVIHDQIIRDGFELDPFIGSRLIDAYAKCDCLEEAHKVFKLLPNPDVVSWGTLINGFADNGQPYRALELFEQIQKQGFKPDNFFYSKMITICANIGASEQGKLLHDEFLRSGCELDTVIGSALIDLYGRCGNLVAAHKVFDELAEKDMGSWSALIAAYASVGLYERAVTHLDEMQKQGNKPDSGFFLKVLAACSNSGVLEVGWRLFNAMINDHGITPSIEHYICMINLFRKAGGLNEAADLLHTIPDDI